MLCAFFGHKYKNVIPSVFNLVVTHDLESERYPAPMFVGKECEHCGHRFVVRTSQNIPVGIENYAADWIAKKNLPEFFDGGYILLGKWNATLPVREVESFIQNQLEQEISAENMSASNTVIDEPKTARSLRLVVNNG